MFVRKIIFILLLYLSFSLPNNLKSVDAKDIFKVGGLSVLTLFATYKTFKRAKKSIKQPRTDRVISGIFHGTTAGTLLFIIYSILNKEESVSNFWGT